MSASLIALSAAVLMSVSSVGGVDMEYEGEVDIYNSSPISRENELQQRVALADGGLYDRPSETFIYTVPGGDLAVYSNIANEMITAGSVRIQADEGLSCKLFLDGEELKDVNIGDIREPGKYSLVVYGVDVEQQIMTFTIVSEKTGAISYYQMPPGFDATGVSVSGRKKAVIDVSRVDMSEEGDYLITYHCNLTDVYYTLSVTIDHTFPEVIFEGVKDGYASGPVTMKNIMAGDAIRIKCNGERFTVPEDYIIRPPGKYEVSVTDDAGNTLTEKFEIKFYLNFQGLLFGLLSLAVIGTAVGYMIWSRKRLKVR